MFFNIAFLNIQEFIGIHVKWHMRFVKFTVVLKEFKSILDDIFYSNSLELQVLGFVWKK